MLLPGGGSNEDNKSLRVGVVLSGGQAPGGHNVISGIFGDLDALNFAASFFSCFIH